MKKLHVYYFSTALSDELYNQIVKECKRFKPTFSGVGFDRNVALGLSEQVDVTGVSLYPIPSYPKFSKLYKDADSYSIKKFSCYLPAMISLPYVKEYWYAISAFNTVKHTMKAEEENVILISGLYRSLIRPAKWLKKKYGLSVFAIVPDLPELMITYRNDYSRLRMIFNELDTKKSIKYREFIDAFVVLSHFMNPIVNRHNKPWITLDGLCDLTAIDQIRGNSSKERFIMYAGKISSTFGVNLLVEGFIKANLGDVKLVLCGDGDYAPELRNIVKKYPNVEFRGAVSHEVVLELEKAATLLVDPRPVDTEISKMSFPSKIIEYMASGTPVLVSNIPSFGPEYLQYQYRIDEVSIDGIECALKRVFSHTDNELVTIGTNARIFVLNNKTIQKQCKRIIELITAVIGKK